MNMHSKTSLPKGYVHNPGFVYPDQIPDRYALRGVGTCMEPLIEDGSLLAFDKREPVVSGDTVNIWFHPERVKPGDPQGIVKRLVIGLPPEDVRDVVMHMAVVIVDQLNPPRQYQIPASHILAIHKCVGFAETNDKGAARFRLKQDPPRQRFDDEPMSA